jgi:hypothetical protein
MYNPNHISVSLETVFLVKILKFFDADPGSGIWDLGCKYFGFGMEKIRILDPQHWTKSKRAILDPGTRLLSCPPLVRRCNSSTARLGCLEVD